MSTGLRNASVMATTARRTPTELPQAASDTAHADPRRRRTARSDPRLQRLQLRRRRHRAGGHKASLHYHFPGKAELGEALIARYAERFAEALARSTAAWPTRRRSSTPTPTCTRTCCASQRMCLCGMLAAEYQTLPKPMRDAVVAFFDDNERWLGASSSRAAPRDAQFAAPPRGRADDHRHPRGSDARRPPLRRSRSIPKHRPGAAGQPRLDRRSLDEPRPR